MKELRFAWSICSLLLFFSFAYSEEIGSYRLPLEVVPSSYNIQLVPYLDEGDSSRQFTFDGKVSILVQAHHPERTITLHAKDITLHGVPTVTEVDSGHSVAVDHVSWDSVRDFLILSLKETMNRGGFYRIHIEYTGILNNNLEGFYRSSYTANGIRRWLATTQFQPTAARLAFPCFDEPALKATFDISIARLPEMNSISNMPLKATFGPDLTLNGRYWDTFETTVKMSTYLVAFVVSDFQNVHNGIYRAWSKPATAQNGQFAADVSPQIMKIFENITRIPYQLPKMDLVAVPQFAAGAMENWGLVTYMEMFLLLPTNPSQMDYENIVGITIHEFAHQWFGNLVSPRWWKYTWLNEGFANHFEYYVTDMMHPEWKDYNRQVQRQFQYMETDGVRDADPISKDVETPSEIRYMFGMISYFKGGAVVKMIQNALTTDTFFKGISRYLSARAYSDAEPDDVSAALQEAVDEDKNLANGIRVKEFIDSWSLQSGYPVVTVTRDYETGTAVLKQEHFLKDGSHSHRQWYIPITYTTSEQLNFNDTKPDLWLIPDRTRVIHNLPSEHQWIILNKKVTGYFRVNYDHKNWQLLLAELNGANYERIHELNRIQLQSDARHLYDGGLLDADTTMNVIKSLERETSPAVWSVGLRGLESLYEKLGGSSYFPALQEFYLPLMKRFYGKISITNPPEENYLMNQIRPDFIRWACFLGIEDCLKSSARILTNIRTTSDDRSYEKLRPSMYCAAVRNNGELSWNWLWDVYQNTEDVKERQQALQALGCTNDSKLLRRLLDLTVNKNSGLKPQDRINAFSAVCNGRDEAACDLVLKFLTPRVQLLADLFGEYESVGTVLHRVASKLRTTEQVQRLRHIIMKNTDNLPGYIITNAVQMAQENVQWLQGKGAEIAEWLSKHSSGQ